MANFNDLKATIASRIPDNTDQLISAEDVRQSFLDTIDEMNAAKEDNGTVAPTEWGMIGGLLTDQDDLETALNGKQAVISDLVTIRQGAAKGNTAYQKPANGIPPSDMTAGVQASLGRADTAYQKPSGGIPKTDLTTAVQSSLGLADSAYQKPSGGIPSTDLASGVRASLARAQSAVQPADLGAVAYSDDYNDLSNKPTIPAAPGALITNITTAQTPSSSEALSGTIKLHKVSKTGSYADLNNKPTIPAAQVNSDWNAVSGVEQILNKPALAAVATSGDYDDLTNKPVIPTVHNMAAGGTTGQVLAKKSNTDYDTEWVNQSGGGGGAAAWGSITGDLDDQTDLKNALAAKQDVISNLATIESGAAAGATAVQPGDLATVATTGDYDDLLNKPSIPAAQVNSDWNAISGVAQILNKPTIPAAPGTLDTTATTAQSTSASEALSGAVKLHQISKTGSYGDLLNKPTIDATPTNASTNAVQSGGVYSALADRYTKTELAAMAETWTFTLDDNSTVTKKIIVLPNA